MKRPRRIVPRMLAPSRILRPTQARAGGGRDREDLVWEAQRAIEEGSKSFAAASRLFDRHTRARVWLLYAWCRRCDDLADAQELGRPARGGEIGDQADAAKRITAIRLLTDRAFEGLPTADPAFDALGLVATECGLTREMADDVIMGFELDAAGWRPRTEADLARYCYHVAGAVGVMMARIMGVPEDDEDALDRAFELGVAFQLCNIARDLSDDDAAGRCYLPLEWLAEADVPPGEHMKPRHREQLVLLAARLVDLAETYEASARLGTPGLAFRQRWAVLTASNIYLAIGRKVRERGAQAWDHRVTTSRLEKLGATFRGFMEALDAPLPVERPVPYSRGQILVTVRMAGPIPPNPMTPLPDEEAL